MQALKLGSYYGESNRQLSLPDLLLTDLVYTHNYVDWHYHEHAYFAYLLKGQLGVTDRKQTHQLETGNLHFHYSEEPHCNHKPDIFTRSFHLEIHQNWFKRYDQKPHKEAGSRLIMHPQQHLLFEQIYRESYLKDADANLSIDALVLQLMSHMATHDTVYQPQSPLWLKRLESILHEETNSLSLGQLAELLDVHPVYLCQESSRVLGCTMGQYRRKLKLTRALTAMRNAQSSLTEVAYMSGFSDQSHFCRVFKQVFGYTPLQYRKKFLQAWDLTP
ncbi:MAG: helix-turn-helix transcriptional regulator [Bacteroidota bacterium]